jgi:hypothetical protein
MNEQETGDLRALLTAAMDEIVALKRKCDEAAAETVRLSMKIVDLVPLSQAEAEARGYRRGINEAVSYLAKDKRKHLTEWDLGEIANAILALKDKAE